MSNVLKISGPIKVGTLTADPSNPVEGYIYFNSTSGQYRFYENGGFRNISAEALEAHLNGGASKHDATEVDYERVDGSKKNIDAASDDVETALTDLDDAIGALDQTPTNYTAADPTIVADHLAGIDTALGAVATDASNITYTPSVLTDWDGDTDPGDVDNALDQLAERVDDNEIAISSNTSTINGHLDGGASKHDATEVDYERVDGSKVDIQAASDTVEAALTDLDDRKISRAGLVAFTADQSMGGNKLTNLADPTADQDAATKAYVDAVQQGLDVKQSVRVASTAAGTLASDFENGDTLDGVVLATGDRILIKDQAAPAENGIYVVQATGAPVRATDADEDSEVTAGLFVFVTEGSTQADTGWILTTNDPIVVDTTGLVFAQFTGAGQVVAGDGLSKSGNTLSVNVDDSTIEINADTLRVKAGGITDNEVSATAAINATKIGNGDVDNTELSYVNGVTSSIQTQLDAKIGSLVEDTTPQLGGNLELNDQAVLDDLNRGATGATTQLVQESYIDAISLLGSQTNTVITELTFAHASYEGVEIVYKLKEATSNDIEIGTIRVVTNGTSVVLNQVSTETAPTGITFDAVVNGANINIRYSSGTNGATMRADVKRIRA